MNDESTVTAPNTVRAFDRKTRQSADLRVDRSSVKVVSPYDFTENDGVRPRSGAAIELKDGKRVLVYEQSFEKVCEIVGFTPPKQG